MLKRLETQSVYLCVCVCVFHQDALPQHNKAKKEAAAISQHPLQRSTRPVVNWKRYITFPPQQSFTVFIYFSMKLIKVNIKKANDTPLYFSIVKQAAYFKNYWLSHTTTNYKLQIYEVKGGRIMSHY